MSKRRSDAFLAVVRVLGPAGSGASSGLFRWISVAQSATHAVGLSLWVVILEVSGALWERNKHRVSSYLTQPKFETCLTSDTRTHPGDLASRQSAWPCTTITSLTGPWRTAHAERYMAMSYCCNIFGPVMGSEGGWWWAAAGGGRSYVVVPIRRKRRSSKASHRLTSRTHHKFISQSKITVRTLMFLVPSIVCFERSPTQPTATAAPHGRPASISRKIRRARHVAI